jgi:hypothetical protein
MTIQPVLTPGACASTHSTYSSDCSGCRTALAELVRQEWEKTLQIPTVRSILTKSGDGLDTKDSLALLHFTIMGSHPAAPQDYVPRFSMMRLLGFQQRATFENRQAAIHRMGCSNYFQALLRPDPEPVKKTPRKRCAATAEAAGAPPAKKEALGDAFEIDSPDFLVKEGYFANARQRDAWFKNGGFERWLFKGGQCEEQEQSPQI